MGPILTTWRGLDNEGVITNFHVPGGTQVIKAKPRGEFWDVNKTLVCHADGNENIIHLTLADGALAQRVVQGAVEAAARGAAPPEFGLQD
jgi:hypothetical protein